MLVWKTITHLINHKHADLHIQYTIQAQERRVCIKQLIVNNTRMSNGFLKLIIIFLISGTEKDTGFVSVNKGYFITAGKSHNYVVFEIIDHHMH